MLNIELLIWPKILCYSINFNVRTDVVSSMFTHKKRSFIATWIIHGVAISHSFSSRLIQIITLRYNLLKLGAALDILFAFSSSAIPHNKHVIKTHFTGSRLSNPFKTSHFIGYSCKDTMFKILLLNPMVETMNNLFF